MKAVVAAFNQEKTLVGAFSVITNLRMELFEALISTHLVTTTVLSFPVLATHTSPPAILLAATLVTGAVCSVKCSQSVTW